ncbi:hypothetical protein, partial [Candidatus Binatus sp.]|uniref:hypothetical protein n=1 Tax=Candidatus Binatus sp. TaxID=2811406 RepID=UPI003CC5691E
ANGAAKPVFVVSLSRPYMANPKLAVAGFWQMARLPSALAGNDWSFLGELCYNRLRMRFCTEAMIL